MRVELVDHDARWSDTAAELHRRLSGSLGRTAIRIEHVGSTAVPGLAAKPVIDLVLTVADPTAESDYSDEIESLGYRLRHREPGWYEHRMFRLDDPATNLHVFADDCVEVERMLRFRDVLRRDATARARYEAVKRALAERDWEVVQAYADAKSSVVAAILAEGGQPEV